MRIGDLPKPILRVFFLPKAFMELIDKRSDEALTRSIPIARRHEMMKFTLLVQRTARPTDRSRLLRAQRTRQKELSRAG